MRAWLLVTTALAFGGGAATAQDGPREHPPEHRGMHDMHHETAPDGGMAGGHGHHHHMNVRFVEGGSITNPEPGKNPLDCPAIRGETTIVVEAGRKHAPPGLTWSFDETTWSVPPCSKVTVTLRNLDEIRHQWMIHGLPAYLYPMGMFTLTADGGSEVTGSFVVPGEKQTYLVHCDVPTHMEQGMKAQLVVDGGRGDLPGIPGRTAFRYRDDYPVGWTPGPILGAIAALAAGLVIGRRFRRR